MTKRTSAAREMYDRYALEHAQFGSTAKLTRLLKDALAGEGEPPGRVIDIGCGEGGTLEAVRDCRAAVFGVELSYVRASVARARGHSVAVGDGLLLPWASAVFDVVISRHVIEHMPDDAQAIREMRRVLRPGGRLYLETPLRLPGAWYFYRGPDGQRALDPTHVREYCSVDAVTHLAETAAFRVVAVETAPIRFPLGQLLARALSKRVRTGAMPERLLRARAALSVPRYREIRLLAEARTSLLTRASTLRPPRAPASAAAIAALHETTTWRTDDDHRAEPSPALHPTRTDPRTPRRPPC